MYQVNIREAKTNLSKLIQKVINGEEVIIAKGNKPVAKLVQLETIRPERKLGTANGLIEIADDFDSDPSPQRPIR